MNGQNRLFYVIKRMVYRYFQDKIPQAAAELSYFLLFSLFPLLMFINAALARLDLALDTIQPILDTLPQSLRELIISYLEQLSRAPSMSLLVTSILMTLYFFSRAVRSMMHTVNHIYRVETSRGAIWNFFLSLGMTAGFLLLLVCSFILLVAGRMILRILPRFFALPQAALNIVHDAGFGLMMLIIFLFLILFNRTTPHIKLRFREIWPGALFSLVAWLLVSWVFSFYVDNMARYSVLYGSLATIIVLMLWLYIVSMVLLMGPQVNHILMVMRLYQLETDGGHTP